MLKFRHILLSLVSGGLLYPCARAVVDHWSIWIAVPLLVAFGFSNFADGYGKAQRMMRRTWNLPGDE